MPLLLGSSLIMACSGADPEVSNPTDTDGIASEEEPNSMDGGESETDADELPPSCEAAIGAVQTPFRVSLEVPADFDDDLDMALDCRVLSVEVVNDMISTALDCVGEDGQPQLAGLDIPAPAEGSPAWQAEALVTLAVRTIRYAGGGLLDEPIPVGGEVQHVAMHRVADGMLLAAGTDAYGVMAQHYSPIQVRLDRDACGADVPEEEWPGPDRNMAVSFSLDDESLTLLGGQAGTLETGDEWLAIDVRGARAIECCHGEGQRISAISRLMTAK